MHFIKNYMIFIWCCWADVIFSSFSPLVTLFPFPYVSRNLLSVFLGDEGFILLVQMSCLFPHSFAIRPCIINVETYQELWVIIQNHAPQFLFIFVDFFERENARWCSGFREPDGIWEIQHRLATCKAVLSYSSPKA